jgi:hypothetical protein
MCTLSCCPTGGVKVRVPQSTRQKSKRTSVVVEVMIAKVELSAGNMVPTSSSSEFEIRAETY